ncbi:MAG: type II secretion system protein GspN [Sandaracinaceae bacterium]
MSSRAKKILFYALVCPVWFLFTLTCGAYFTFPYDHVRDFVVQEAERDGAIRLDIESLEPSFLTGVSAEGVRVTPVTDRAPGETTALVIDEANARVSLLSLLAGETEVDFDSALTGAGIINGTYADTEEAMTLQAHLETVNMRQLSPLQAALGIPLGGMLSGDIDLTIANEAAGTEGESRLRINNLSIGDGVTPLEIEALGGAGVTLEQLNLGPLTFRMDVEDGTGTIEELHADGEHAEFWGTGTIRLARDLRRSAIDMMVRINFKEAYRTSSPRMGALFMLLDNNPQVRPARTSDGALQWRIQGSFGGRVRMVPSGRVPMPEAD